MLNVGEEVHIIPRRLFETDLRRQFAGQVTEISETAILEKGYVYVFDESLNDFVRQETCVKGYLALGTLGWLSIYCPSMPIWN